MTAERHDLLPPISEADWKRMSWHARKRFLDRVNGAIRQINESAEVIKQLIQRREQAEIALATTTHHLIEARRSMARTYAEIDAAKADLAQIRQDVSIARTIAEQQMTARSIEWNEEGQILGRIRLAAADEERMADARWGPQHRPLKAVS